MNVLLAESIWNSLEVIKLLVGILGPITLVVLGFIINRRLQSFEHLQWASQRVVEKRLEVFDKFVPLLNDLLCYMTYVGAWKDIEPPQAVRLKRMLDRIAYVNAPLFPPEFLRYYNQFIEQCYSTFAGWGRDAQLRTKVKLRQEASGDAWKEQWNECFCEDQAVEPSEVQKAYSAFMKYFAESLGIGVRMHDALGRTPDTNTDA